MTFSGTSRSAMTLAHELGHAWHNDVLYDQAPPRREITSSTAESASTFGEALFRDHLFGQAPNDAIRIQMLDQQLMAGVSFLMGLPIRFEFERALYPLADKGPFNPADLTRIWNQMWRQGYGGRLDDTDTLGWCSTLHYYISHFGFYNWPYTFGYLFSGHIYQQAKNEGPAFQKTMRELLTATGCMNTVPLAQSILGVDLRDPAFWTQSIQPLLDIEQLFMALTEPLVSDKKLEA
jgi:oligoendopeptidase F